MKAKVFGTLLMSMACTAAYSFKEEASSSMNAPNPVKRYVHVEQQGVGREVQFLLCDEHTEGCKSERTKKHLDGGGNRKPTLNNVNPHI